MIRLETLKMKKSIHLMSLMEMKKDMNMVQSFQTWAKKFPTCNQVRLICRKLGKLKRDK